MVAAASEEASTNGAVVASATEKWRRRSTRSAVRFRTRRGSAGDAVDQARKTSDRVSELSRPQPGSGTSVELINTIAGPDQSAA